MPRPTRETVYRRLDQAVADLASVGGLPLPAEARGIWRDIWHRETHHSTAIEGNTLALRQVQLLLFEGRAVGSKELREYLEVQGYAEAAEWVYAQAVGDAPGGEARLVSLAEVREIHRLVVESVWLHFPPEGLDSREGSGSFRRHNIEALGSGIPPPDWTEVPPRVTDWVERANLTATGRVLPIVERFAELHADFERIHPFRDGNGRVGRLLVNLQLVRRGYPPAVILKSDRDRYLNALRHADDGDPGPLGELLARAIKHSIDRFLLPGLAGPHRLVPLTALAESTGLTRNALLLAARRGRLRATTMNGQWYSTRGDVEEYKARRYQRGSEAPALRR